MWPNPQFPAHVVTFTEEVLNGKLYFLRSVCGVLIPSHDTNILEFNQYLKLDKTLSIIYSDPQYLIKRVDGCKNNF